MLTWVFGPPRGIPGSPWGPVGAVFTVLLVSVLAVALAGVVMAGVVAVTPWLRQAVETRCAGASGIHCITGVVGALGLVYFFVVTGLMVACGFRRGASLDNSLMLRSARWRLWQYAVFAVVTVGFLVLLQQVLFHVTDLFGIAPEDPSGDLERLRQYFNLDNPASVVLMGLLAVVLAPLAEEFVFRGFLFGAFQKSRLGVVGSAILLSVAWSVTHWGYSSQNLVALFGLGLLFAYIVWRTGSLWPAIVGHAANNLVAVVALLGHLP
ncbi:MAG: CPBP family intramembrane glutamic endopeptidase [Hyphomicrobiales bacterium]